jgi:hypothetical protein
MQFSKTLLTCGAAALCLVVTSARAVDTEADLKLREALRQKMAEVGPETSTTAPAPSKPAKPAKTVKAPAKPAPVAPAAPVVAAPVVVAPVAEPAPVAPAVAAPAAAQPAASAPVDEAQAERLREAVRARLAQDAATQPQPQQVVTHGSDLEPTMSTTTIVAAPPAAITKPTAKAPVTLEAPALPISGSKEQRLATLLQQYKADQITPQQYHEERAKILAE